MSTAKVPPATTGLRGQAVGTTDIATVGKEGVGLTYRGYAIEELAAHSSFEEVAYLLIHGALPAQPELDAFRLRLKQKRQLPDALRKLLELIPADAHPMDVLRTACSFLGSLEPETSFAIQKEVSERLMSVFPSALAYWYHFAHKGERIATDDDANSLAGHYLTLLHGDSPSEASRRALDTSLILYAEHEFNASTFACRVCAATLSDFYSCVTAGIGTLRGPLHGGAMADSMSMKSITIRPPRSRRRNWRATSSAASRLVRAAVSSMSAPLVARAEFTSIATRASVWSITMAPPEGNGTVREYAVSIWCSIWKRENSGT